MAPQADSLGGHADTLNGRVQPRQGPAPIPLNLTLGSASYRPRLTRVDSHDIPSLVPSETSTLVDFVMYDEPPQPVSQLQHPLHHYREENDSDDSDSDLGERDQAWTMTKKKRKEKKDGARDRSQVRAAADAGRASTSVPSRAARSLSRTRRFFSQTR